MKHNPHPCNPKNERLGDLRRSVESHRKEVERLKKELEELRKR